MHVKSGELKRPPVGVVWYQKEIDRCVWRRCVDSTPVPELFAKFRSGNFDVEDAPRLGRPVEADKDALKILPDNTTINSELYCHQLDKLNDALRQKRSELINRKGVVFHQDNARPHTSLVTRQKTLQLEWDTMPHLPHSPDLEPSDYYLFRSSQNF
ncbi:histone-lysine N-methyltransferase SETMAR [Trichonephila clavipes]|nr:histone-lysine N-methyltransferase SETMAR [Trichonephila clavipes]